MEKRGEVCILTYLSPSGPIMKVYPIAEIPLVEYISPDDIRKTDPLHRLSDREHRPHR